MSESTETPITAIDFIESQLQLEKDARESMPYEPGQCTFVFDTEALGRQQLYACLTCRQKSPNNTPNVICYSCSIQCHSEHELIELFTKRKFTCDCGTTRMPPGGCRLRKNFDSLDPPDTVNNASYNHNFEGRFCACDVPYNVEDEKGTMIQCLLGDVCGEDWFHEECILGLELGSVYKTQPLPSTEKEELPIAKVYPEGVNMFDQLDSAVLEHVKAPTETSNEDDSDDDDEDETLEGLPNVDQFDSFICWKCVAKHKPAMLNILATPGVALDPVLRPVAGTPLFKSLQDRTDFLSAAARKRKSDQDPSLPEKRVKLKSEASSSTSTEKGDSAENTSATANNLTDTQDFSVFLLPEFRSHILKSADPLITKLSASFPFLAQPEPSYDPPADDDANSSLLDAGAQALNTLVPRQRALEGIQAYDMIKQKLNAFFKPFAESGKVVTENDVNGFFEKVRNERET